MERTLPPQIIGSDHGRPPLEVPEQVVVYLAEQLGIEDVSQVKRYAERRATPFEHQEEIRKVYGLREFGSVEAEFTAWVDARAWSTGDGKKTIFHDGVVWLREHKVLLPGVTTLARLVARVRDDATVRLYDALYYVMTPPQRAVMQLLLEAPDDRRGVTWLNMINDRGAGLGAKVVTGTVRDSLYMIDVAFRRDGGARPEVLVTDTGSYSDIVFGLVHLLGMQYRPALADIPDQKGWRIQNTDYGPLNRFARGKIDLDKIRRHWPDILRMIQRDGNPTPLGDAIAHYGRIFKTLHILTYAVEEPYRRNLQEGRHALASRIFHGKKGELYQRYHRGMEDQLGALGLVLDCITLWNTFYIDAALDQLKEHGYPVLEEDVARLSPFARRHINVNGTYSFSRPDRGPTGVRALRDTDQPDRDEDQS